MPSAVGAMIFFTFTVGVLIFRQFGTIKLYALHSTSAVGGYGGSQQFGYSLGM